jgi:hypothetical protein
MEARTTIIDRQNLLDIALQETGSIEGVFELATANDIAVSDEVSAGTELKVPEGNINADVLRQYKANNIKPATGNIQDAEILEGIGYWHIEMDFISS